MAMDDRKQRIMMAIVSLYADEGEPVGSNLLSHYFDMAVSSATLRNEMAALTRLGLLEQPHTSAGRIPTAKGFRYYVDNILKSPFDLPKGERKELEDAFTGLDFDPEKMVQGAADSLSSLLRYAVIATTPRSDDMSFAHFEVVQVGRNTASILAVTTAGGVRTRVARVDFELTKKDAVIMGELLNRHLRFVAGADVDAMMIRSLMDSLGMDGHKYWPLVSAAVTLMSEVGKPNIYFEGQQYLLQWLELDKHLRPMMSLLADPERLEQILQLRQEQTTVLLGEEFPQPIPGMCLVTRQYLAGGGLKGSITVAGPARMDYRKVIPKLEYFSSLLGQGMSGTLAI